MTSISNQPSIPTSYQTSFHYVELKTLHSTMSSSSSLLSSSSSSSSVNGKGSLEKSSEKQQRRRKKKNAHETIDLSSLQLPDFPIKTQCPKCNKFVETHLKYQNGTCVYVLSMGLLVLTVALFWVPFLMDSCKDVTHFCPDCKYTLGKKKRI